MDVIEQKQRLYSLQGLWSLFLVCAFPLHIWTIILSLRDMSWVIERTNVWDAVGVASYGLVFAFIESVAVFGLVALLGLLLPARWESHKRVALMTVLILLASIWAMLGQLYFIWKVNLSGQAIKFFVEQKHPLRMLYAFVLAAVAPTIVLPVFLFLRSDKVKQSVLGLVERLSLITVFYLFFDVLGLVVIIIRNVT